MSFSYHRSKYLTWTWYYSETTKIVIHACQGPDRGELSLGQIVEGPICPTCKLSVPDFIQLAANLNVTAYSA